MKLDIAGTPREIYEQHIVPAIFARWAPELVEVAGVRLGERVLDVACGTGVVTRLLADTPRHQRLARSEGAVRRIGSLSHWTIESLGVEGSGR